jgi:hypothetical protein
VKKIKMKNKNEIINKTKNEFKYEIKKILKLKIKLFTFNLN